ncbi:hypothetical protein FD754_023946 [Muntiacus muntjak]|uniref:Peptidase S1 domain-containing protein n=1 Tax=Muntiacus muntjak TaxID=9888 RepID=A0A5N3URP9_MUNMU|nr:hypothetical protein FD754_023946 [Muntiacus muntjak]
MVLFLLLAVLLFPTGEAAGSLLSFFQGKSSGGMRPSHTPIPYMAFVEYQVSEDLFSCVGFLVHEDFVLTAAHCLGKIQQVIPGTGAIRHPDCNGKTWPNDIMLLQLMTADLTDSVSPINLPRSWQKVKPGVCSVADWGQLGVDMPCADKLREVGLKVQREEICITCYAGDPNKRKNSFSGDSGGPLVCNGVAQGIVSCGEEYGRTPNVHTRISSFLSWIQTTVRQYKWQGST